LAREALWKISSAAAANGEVDFEVLDAEKCHEQMVITGASVR
jgi:hypothetical protein